MSRTTEYTIEANKIDEEVYLAKGFRKKEGKAYDDYRGTQGCRTYAKAMSELLGIPRRTIENWDKGISAPAEWVERLVVEKLESYVKEKNG